MDNHGLLRITKELFEGWKIKMTGSSLLVLVGVTSIAIGLNNRYAGYATYLFALSAIALVIFLYLAIIALIRKKMVRITELETLLAPNLSIMFVEAPPYVVNKKDLGVGDCRKIRIGVKNNSLLKATNVSVKLESCTPGANTIHLKQKITSSEMIPSRSIGPDQEELFDLITELADQFYINFDIQYNGPMTDKQPREIELSANCDESVPARATFRIAVGHDGFFVLRQVV